MHQQWMQLALEEARKAFDKAEVPVGAVIVKDDEVVGRGHNLVETLQDPTAHAEMIAISAAVNKLSSWRLDDASLYVTLEPCPMCMGAVHLARISSVVFAVKDPRLGACGSVVDLTDLKIIRPPLKISDGLFAEESKALLQLFFKRLRDTPVNMGQ